MTAFESMNESFKKAGEELNELSMKVRISSLEKEINDKKCQINEMRQHIECLKAELEKAHCNTVELPYDPIKVAEMLIDSSVEFTNVFGKNAKAKRYDKQELRQIAQHLLVYCNGGGEE